MNTIRSATQADLSAIMELLPRAVTDMNVGGNPQWGPNYPTVEHYIEALEGGSLYTVISSEGVVLGCASLNTDEDPAYAPLPWSVPSPAMVIHKMVVDPNAQRQGVASALFDHCEMLARGQGLASLRIDTYTKNERMQALILKKGFQRVGHVHFTPNPLPYPCFEKLL